MVQLHGITPKAQIFFRKASLQQGIMKRKKNTQKVILLHGITLKAQKNFRKASFQRRINFFSFLFHTKGDLQNNSTPEENAVSASAGGRWEKMVPSNSHPGKQQTQTKQTGLHMNFTNKKLKTYGRRRHSNLTIQGNCSRHWKRQMIRTSNHSQGYCRKEIKNSIGRLPESRNGHQ